MHRTPDEIKKGLECCAGMHNHSYCKECPYADCDCDEMSSDALAYIKELEEREWQLFDLLSSTWFTKACYFKQEDGTVYSRVSGKYMTFEQAIDEFAHELTDEAQVPRWISVEDEQKPKHGKEYLCVCSLPDDPKHEWDWMAVLRWFAYGTNGFVDRPHFTDEGLNGVIVTHWMELPKLPREVETNA